MSNTDFNLDDILAEFGADSTPAQPAAPARPAATPKPAAPAQPTTREYYAAQPQQRPATENRPQNTQNGFRDFTFPDISTPPDAYLNKVHPAPPTNAAERRAQENETARTANVVKDGAARQAAALTPERSAAQRRQPQTRTVMAPAKRANIAPDSREASMPAVSYNVTGEKKRRAPEEPVAKKSGIDEAVDSFGIKIALGLLAVVLAVISLAGIAWSALNLHPDISVPVMSTTSGETNTAALAEKSFADIMTAQELEAQAEIEVPEVTPEPEPEKIVYTIGEHEQAPAPNPACYGTVSNSEAYLVLDVIEKARQSGLLEEQDVIFTPDTNFYWDSNIQYYYDETILVVCWKEWIDNFVVSCCEVKIADASQFRRKFAGDTFGYSNQYYATQLASEANAVVAMNADFYQFRDFGIVVQDRELYRFYTSTYTGMYKKYNCIDTCFVTSSGDFIFSHRLQEFTEEEMRQFIADNDILFSIAFGPVIIEDGELKYNDWYPAGEITSGYSRAAIGIYDHLHYLYMTVNHYDDSAARVTVDKFGEYMFNKGIQNGYNLDGGQTGEVVFQGVPYNAIDFGSERLVSDIIYFATALPETEG